MFVSPEISIGHNATAMRHARICVNLKQNAERGKLRLHAEEKTFRHIACATRKSMRVARGEK